MKEFPKLVNVTNAKYHNVSFSDFDHMYFEICIVINDKSQGDLGMMNSLFITQSAGERISKTSERLMKLQTKLWLFSALHSHCIFVLKDADLAR